MYTILHKRTLSPQVKLMEVEAPAVARKAQPGQFIIFRVDEAGERIPLTVADSDPVRGSVTIIFQEVGASTRQLGALEEGDGILDFVGPLGLASHLDGYRRAAVVGGGLGTAIAWPQAKKLRELGCAVDAITGFRNTELILLEEEMTAASDRLFVMTDDGSNGHQGFVTAKLQQLIDEGAAYDLTYDLVIAIGPLPMMRAVCELTRPYGIKTLVSMNPVMIDGTGMCGGCRVLVGGEVKFACVDGPDFDGHQVDFAAAMQRQAMFRPFEQQALEAHNCRLTGGEAHA